MKIVINKCFGGFSVSEEVYKELGVPWDRFGYLSGYEDEDEDVKRDNPLLIAAIEKIGEEESSGRNAALKIVEIPEGVAWYIHEHAGRETICESHRSWG